MKTKTITPDDLKPVIEQSDGAVLLLVKGDRYSVVSWGRNRRLTTQMGRIAADLSDAIMEKHIDLQE